MRNILVKCDRFQYFFVTTHDILRSIKTDDIQRPGSKKVLLEDTAKQYPFMICSWPDKTRTSLTQNCVDLYTTSLRRSQLMTLLTDLFFNYTVFRHILVVQRTKISYRELCQENARICLSIVV